MWQAASSRTGGRWDERGAVAEEGRGGCRCGSSRTRSSSSTYETAFFSLLLLHAPHPNARPPLVHHHIQDVLPPAWASASPASVSSPHSKLGTGSTHKDDMFCVLLLLLFLIVYIRAWKPNRRHLHGHKLDGGTGPNWECAADSASTAALIYLHCSASAPPPPTSLPVSLSPSPPLPFPLISSSPLSSSLLFPPPHSHTGFLEHEGRWRGWWSCIQRGAGPPDCLHV